MVITGLFVLMTVLKGCAAVGPPIAPEEVGIEAKIRKHQKENQAQGTSPEYPGTPVAEDETIELPVFYPIGTR